MSKKYIVVALLAVFTLAYVIIPMTHTDNTKEEVEIIVKEEKKETKESKPLVVEQEPAKSEVEIIAKTLYGECRGIPSDKEKAAVAWVILNRVDAGFGKSILEVVTEPYQFIGYQESHPVLDSLASLSKDVLERWNREKSGESNVGRVLPSDYLFFSGDGSHNYFRKEFRVYEYWDWSLENPYKN